MSAPAWEHWDGDTFAKLYHGREVTLASSYKVKLPTTTSHRADYPVPPLFWKHTPKPFHADLHTGPFDGTTSYRADFVSYADLAAARPQRRPYPEQKFRPKLQTATETRQSFQRPPLPPPRPKTAQAAFRSVHGSTGTTTMRADFQQWPMPQRHTRNKEEVTHKQNKLQTSTTTRSDYQVPKGLQPPPTKFKKSTQSALETGPFESTTEYRASYDSVQLPEGLPATIGIQVASSSYKSGGVGGQFEVMIRQGAPSPCIVQKTFTTVVDAQNKATIVVVAKRPEYPHGVVLGTFSLSGFKGPTGVPKMEVTLKLADERTLHASAVYKQGGKAKALTFRARAGPKLRKVTQVDDVPDDF
jgi:hypothetical protein